jgi:trimeric autotransporter adhesin
MSTRARTVAVLVAAATLAVAGEAAAQRETPFDEAVRMATTGRETGERAERVATDIVATLRLSTADALRAIREGGYQAGDGAAAATEAFRMPVQDGVAQLILIGYLAPEIVQAYRSRRASTSAIAEGLGRSGHDGRQALRDLMSGAVRPGDAAKATYQVYRFAAASAASGLRDVGLDAAAAAAALVEAGYALDVVVSALRQAGYPATEVFPALIALGQAVQPAVEVMAGAGFPVADIVVAAASVAGGGATFGAAYVAIAGGLFAAGVTAIVAAEALVAAGASLDQAAAALSAAGYLDADVAAAVKALAANLTEAAAALRLAGWLAIRITPLLFQALMPDQAIAGLIAAGYRAGEAAAAVRQTFDASFAQIAAGLLSAGVAGAEVVTALRESLGASARATAEAMLAAAGESLATLDALREGLDATAREVHVLMMDLIQLRTLFAWHHARGIPAVTAAGWARDGGASAEEIVVALRDGYSASVQETAVALKQAGETNAVALFRALHSTFDLTLKQAAALNAQLMYSVETLVDALVEAYQVTPQEVLAALGG